MLPFSYSEGIYNTDLPITYTFVNKQHFQRHKPLLHRVDKKNVVNDDAKVNHEIGDKKGDHYILMTPYMS